MEYDEKKIKQILQNAKTIAVVGLSRKRHRDSYRVAEYLQQSGYRIIPVNPSLREEVLGEKPYPNLSAVPIPIDIVNIFRKSEDVPPIVEEALSLAPQCIWTVSYTHLWVGYDTNMWLTICIEWNAM